MTQAQNALRQHRQPGGDRRRTGRRGGLGALLAVVALFAVGLSGAAARESTTAPPTPLHVGFSPSMFTDVNENDARASVKVWTTTVAEERGVNVDPDPQIFRSFAELSDALQRDEVDVAGITAVEYFTLEASIEWGTLFLATIGDDLFVRYVLLVHRDSPIEEVGDLRDKSLLAWSNSRLCLGLPWLDTLLLEEGYGVWRDFGSGVTEKPKLSQVVLPVFFGQAEACLVTEFGYQTMVELNPQIGRGLRILATSPEVAPTAFAFRQGYDSPEREGVLAGLRELHRSVAGRQVLTVFQSDRLEEHPASIMDGARELLARRRALLEAGGLSVEGPPPVASVGGSR